MDEIINQMKNTKDWLSVQKATTDIAYPLISKYQILEVEFDAMWQQLKDDKIIICPDDNNRWKLSIKGLSFSYVQNKIDNANLENAVRNNEKSMRRLTYIIAFGTLVAAIYYAFELNKNHFHWW
ncbi:MAG TPA: hypothetical protein VF411_07795 [Bacteroidia bacterium]